MDINDTLARMNRAADIAIRYGVSETNNIAFADYDHTAIEDDVYLDDPRLVRIDRLRLLTEPGYPYYDVSYCYGTLADGRHVRVQLDEHRLSRRNIKGDLIAMAKRAGRYAKGLGLLDDNNWSILR